MVKYQDLKGKRFGYLVAIEKVDDFESNGTTKKWKCKCDCGNFINLSARVLNEALKNKRNISCGCSRKKNYINNIFGNYLVISYRKDLESTNKYYVCKCIKCGDIQTLSSKQLYKQKKCFFCMKKESVIIKKLKHKLSMMKARCYDEKNKDYINYGARGIKIYEEWLGNSDKFVKWALENGYKPELTIDRIDNNKGYYPDNCRWTTSNVQNNNKRNNLIIEYKGKKQTLKQWCDELNLPYRKTHKRIYTLNWSFEKVLENEHKKE